MISWKYSLEKINGELELAKKKREALDKLRGENKVSQLTYDSFSNEIAEAIAEIEAKQSTLVEKLKAKVSELEQQMKTLEYLLVNSEIRHVSEEIEEEAYVREHNVLALGLETTRQELDEIKEAIFSLTGQDISTPAPPTTQIEEGKPQEEPEAEKSLEIVMDTETTTSIETTLEDESEIEERTEIPIEEAPESEDSADSPVEEIQTPFQSEEEAPSSEAETSEAAEALEEASSEISFDEEEETAEAEE